MQQPCKLVQHRCPVLLRLGHLPQMLNPLLATALRQLSIAMLMLLTLHRAAGRSAGSSPGLQAQSNSPGQTTSPDSHQRALGQRLDGLTAEVSTVMIELTCHFTLVIHRWRVFCKD